MEKKSMFRTAWLPLLHTRLLDKTETQMCCDSIVNGSLKGPGAPCDSFRARPKGVPHAS